MNVKRILDNKYVMGILKIIGAVIILTMVLTLLNFFNLLGTVFLNIFKILIPLIALLFGTYHIGKRTVAKGWLEGIKIGVGISVFVVLFNLLGLSRGIDVKLFVYIIIIIAISILGSMLGITRTKEAE